MKKMIRIASLAAAMAFGMAGNAQAFNVQDLKPYAGGGAGLFSFDLAGGSVNTMGFYAFGGADVPDLFGSEDLQLSVEARVGSTGTASATYLGVPVSNKLDYFLSTLAKVKYPVARNLKVYGLLGGTYGSFTTTTVLPFFGATTTSATTSSVSFGAGVNYEIGHNLSINGEVVKYFSDVSAVSGTVQYNF